MIFAYLLLNYDFKPLEKKPSKFWVVRFQVPMPANIEVGLVSKFTSITFDLY